MTPGATSGSKKRRPAARSVSSSRIATWLADSGLFGGLGPSDRRRLAPAFELSVVPGGRILFRQGERGDAVYVVVTGRLRAYLDTPEGEQDLGEVGPGQVIGEMALLSRGIRTASVRAVRDSQLLRLEAEAFDRVVRTHPDVAMRVAAVLADRATRTDGGGQARVRTVAVVPAGAAAPPLDGFCRSLAAALRAHGRAKHLDARVVDRAVRRTGGKKRDDESTLIGWLHGVEVQHRFVVYECDPAPTDWTFRCLRQADVVLLLGRGGSDSRASEVEAATLRATSSITHARRELVLVWPPGRRPHSTAEWLRSRVTAAHHHVVDDACFRRLARRIAGNAVGLVLGGGGARGLAHLGVMRAIDEAGIPVDAVGGTSIGAIMGAGYAMGWEDEVRVAKAISAFVNTRILVGPTLPVVALSSSKKITRLLRGDDYFGETAIEDLPLPFFAVSANLSRPGTVVLERGPLWLALRASASLPGVLPPVFLDGDLLVDGGVVNDVPVRPMRQRVDGTIIACDINPDVDLRVREPIEPTLSGWRVLGRKLNPFAQSLDVPNAIELIMRAKEVGGRQAQYEDLAAHPPDLLLRPPTHDVGTLDFKAGRQLIERGYDYAAEQLSSSPVTRDAAGPAKRRRRAAEHPLRKTASGRTPRSPRAAEGRSAATSS